MKRIAAAVLLLLAACGERPGENAAAELAVAAAREREVQEELARDERQFVETLQKTKALAGRSAPLVLYEVTNPFDPDYEAAKSRPKAAQYPILRTLDLPERRAGELVAKLTDRGSYFPPGQVWTCLFEPHHVLVLGTGADQITAVICVKCGDVDFIAGGRSIGVHSLTPAANGALTGLLSPGVVEETRRRP